MTPWWGAGRLFFRAVAVPIYTAAALAGCASPGCRSVLSAQLLFGAPADPAAFDDFLDRSVSPRFPAGLTLLDGFGRWRAPDGRMTMERSKLVLIVTPDGPETRSRLEEVRAEYKTRFNQQSVGLLIAPTCADF